MNHKIVTRGISDQTTEAIMANSTLGVTTKAAITTFSAILISTVPLGAQAFIFLLPLVVGDGDKPMKATDIMKAFVENTVVAELPKGTGYAFLKADGGSVGLHPEHGKLEGYWNVDSGGETCVTWSYPSGAITNCANVFELGDGKYQWGEREFFLKQGDVKNLDRH